MSSEPDLSVVVPLHDGERHIRRLADRLLALAGPSVHVVFVDDRSSDSSWDVIDDLAEKEPAVTGIRLPVQGGAGVARNVGFGYAVGRYTLFFDVDDDVHVDALTTAISLLDSTGSDVAILAYEYQRGLDTAPSGMVSHDVEIWRRYVGAAESTVTTLARAPKLLEMTNYPWNKIVRTDHFRSTGLRFGATPVHNDILGHWQTLLEARTIVLVNEVVATHVVQEGERNLTNRRGASRLALFDALDETYAFLEERPDLRQHYANHYWTFAVRTMTWAERRILPEYEETFRRRRREHMARMDLGDYARMRRRRDPALADHLVSMTIF